ncbi:MAG: hypothetical protein U9Q81_20515 [Pseudomonadota bacterium]|nr:hypothetical protein [Pseudomonadota bacterium]
MKLAALGCKTLRDGIIVSFIFFLAAIAMILAGRFVVPNIAYMPQVIVILGLILLVMAPFILIATYLHTAAPRDQGESGEK